MAKIMRVILVSLTTAWVMGALLAERSAEADAPAAKPSRTDKDNVKAQADELKEVDLKFLLDEPIPEPANGLTVRINARVVPAGKQIRLK